MVENLNYWLALGTIALQIGTVGLLALYFLQDTFPDLQDIGALFSRWGLWFGFLLSFAASAMTVIHSSIFGLPPCPLCWWQRAFLYPQVILFALALWKRDRSVADYSIALSLVGLGIGLYHHILQMYPSGSLPCPSDGGVSCTQIFFLEFGYITYPMMAITTFSFLVILMLFIRQKKA